MPGLSRSRIQCVADKLSLKFNIYLICTKMNVLFFFNLLATTNPCSCCNFSTSSIHFESIFPPSESYNILSFQNTFRTNFSIWHMSKMTWTGFPDDGCLNVQSNLRAFQTSAPSNFAVFMFLYAPIKCEWNYFCVNFVHCGENLQNIIWLVLRYRTIGQKICNGDFEPAVHSIYKKNERKPSCFLIILGF